MFAQINPGHIGRLTPSEIELRYKTESSKKRAQLKQKATSGLLLFQNAFANNPSIETWNQLNSGYNRSIRHIWGWPPGKYLSTIEKHGVKIDNVALINLAQCPVPKDKYSKIHFSNCWELHTKRLINALKPKYIVAQGKAAYTFLHKQDLGKRVTLIEGNHHASRQSNMVKNKLFDNAKSLITYSGP